MSVERAREAIEDAMSGSAAMAQVKATLAVAEATLALVEQQRFANLIAMTVYNARTLEEYRHRFTDEQYDREREKVDRAFKRLRAGLGSWS